MIRLSRLTDYAVTLLSHMGKEGEENLWAASDLAETSGLPMPTVAKIMKLLTKSNLITAQRGASGGYRLARPMTDISVAAIIEAMDGPIAITDCSEGSLHQGCRVESLCPVSEGWNKVNRVVRSALENVTLAEMYAPLPSRNNKAPETLHALAGD
ncbi:MAG: SUF system Fe-S cluster assembly regulator [Alphaproteobacteria bacterium]